MSPSATFPQLGDYGRVWSDLAELIACDVMAPPPITRRTLELGSAHSPEFVCIPFKYNLGNFIEALDAGADVLIQAGGGCRFGYYGEVQEKTLRDLGYEFDFVQLSTSLNARDIVRFVRRYNPLPRRGDVKRVVQLALDKVRALDELDELIRPRVGFEAEPGSFDRARHGFLDDVEQSRTSADVARVLGEYRAVVEELPVVRPERPLRIGIVGELYVLMEPFSNMGVERYLARRGVEVHRFCTVSSLIEHAIEGRPNLERMLARTSPYVEYHLGAEATESVYKTLELKDAGFDGVVHMKPFG
jgi:predicted nucleotide-binding protein (sugar kinase/HSP70/actin superfamily)